MTRRVTIADVAREAGVSLQTVSRVLNNKGEIRPETRSHILAIIERLGYRPNALARDPSRPSSFAGNPQLWNDGSDRFYPGQKAPDVVGRSGGHRDSLLGEVGRGVRDERILAGVTPAVERPCRR